ncbi:hypothetical protein TNCV_3785991 [Trichonephila clavipes]|nr:hypothetical protein TNCV_3785991 [Trichonephila clavipes]
MHRPIIYSSCPWLPIEMKSQSVRWRNFIISVEYTSLCRGIERVCHVAGSPASGSEVMGSPLVSSAFIEKYPQGWCNGLLGSDDSHFRFHARPFRINDDGQK